MTTRFSKFADLDNVSQEVKILLDPAYREKYNERVREAVLRGYDMIHYADGSIVFVVDKLAFYPYEWNSKRREFDRARFASDKKSKSDKGGHAHVSEASRISEGVMHEYEEA